MEPEPRPEPDRRMHSATSWVPQFQDGPKAWANVFMADDAAVRVKRYRSGPDILLGEIMRFAVLRDPVSAAEASGAYDLFLRGGMPVEVRREILRHASGFQGEANLPIEVYLPFIDKDPDARVCAGAVIDWVSSAELHYLPRPLLAMDLFSNSNHAEAIARRGAGGCSRAIMLVHRAPARNGRP